jgi:hypothetical protein
VMFGGTSPVRFPLRGREDSSVAATAVLLGLHIGTGAAGAQVNATQ